MTELPVVRTVCPYCGVGCGLTVTLGESGVRLKGDLHHPANYGNLCSKGAALGETLSMAGRLLKPRIGSCDTEWSEALNEVASRFGKVLEQHGPEAIAIFGSAQLMTEDYYVINKFMKGYVGSANFDTNSRLCMASSVAGHIRAFGEDVVPGCYEDLELADLVVVVGANAAFCHPVLFRRILEERSRRPAMRLVVIDPRSTVTASLADLHLSIKPGTDAWLFTGLLEFLRSSDRVDRCFVTEWVTGADKALEFAALMTPTIEATAGVCGLDVNDLARFFDWFASTDRTVTLWSQGINQSATGTDKVNAIINVHLATGRIGRPGTGPFSLTGQPNAMGGREVGGLANQLAAHLTLGNPAHHDLLQEFWNSPTMIRTQGLKALDLFRAVEEGSIRALWIMGTNPVVSLPDAGRVRDALSKCEFLVVSDCMAETDLAPLAHVFLPALAWGEKEGTVTNSERCISRQRAFLPSPLNARPDWWMVSEVAKRMGFEAGFPYRTVREIFIEHAALSGYRNAGERRFDISLYSDLSDDDYEALPPRQWPLSTAEPSGTQRLMVKGGFLGGGAKSRMVVPNLDQLSEKLTETYPFALLTGRVRDQWHTMTRTGKSFRLNLHDQAPFVEVHPDQADALLITDGDLVLLKSAFGQLVVEVHVTPEVFPGTVFMPIHWTSMNSTTGRVNVLVNPLADPVSGEPESKHTPVSMQKWHHQTSGVILSRRKIDLPGMPYVVAVSEHRYTRYELAGFQASGGRDFFQNCFDHFSDGADDLWLELEEADRSAYRSIWIHHGRLEALIFFGEGHWDVPRDPLAQWFGRSEILENDHAELFSLALRRRSHRDPILCCCYQVTRGEISAEILRPGGCRSVGEVGSRLRAGQACGTCRPEIEQLIQVASRPN